MADGLKKAAIWLGLVSDSNYAESEPGAEDVTEEVVRDGVAPTLVSRAQVARSDRREKSA